MRDVVLVYGTRPEAIKLGPVAAELRALGVSPTLIATGQHSDLLCGTPAESDLRESYSLGIRSDGDVKGWVNEAILRIASALPARNAIVVVQGDTMSAYAAALAATDLGLTLAHVEAGIRSHDVTEPDPEERFRVDIGRMADIHYAPTELAKKNLESQRVSGETVVTGNTVVSALDRYATLEHVPEPENQILVTMHRREFLADENRVRATFKTLREAAIAYAETRFVVPMHPALRQVLRPAAKHTPRNLLYVNPLPYRSMIDQLRRSRGVLTDSGGLSEEAAALGVPTGMLRRVIDRPEAVQCGIAQQFTPDSLGMASGIAWILQGKPPRDPKPCFGGPESAKQVATHLLSYAIR